MYNEDDKKFTIVALVFVLVAVVGCVVVILIPHKEPEPVEVTPVEVAEEEPEPLKENEVLIDPQPTDKQNALLQDSRYQKMVLQTVDGDKFTIIVPPKYEVVDTATTIEDRQLLSLQTISEDKTHNKTIDVGYISNEDTARQQSNPMIESYIKQMGADTLTDEQLQDIYNDAYKLFDSQEYDSGYYIRGLVPLTWKSYISKLNTSLFDENQPDIHLPNAYYDLTLPNGILRVSICIENDSYLQLLKDLAENSFDVKATNYDTIQVETLKELDKTFENFSIYILYGDFSSYFSDMQN